MLGAIIGDVVGSPYEGSCINWVDDKTFPLFSNQHSRFTDDTILTCATADAILESPTSPHFNLKYIEWAKKYPGRGYGSGFNQWVENNDPHVINKSYANGCMMRCSPIGLYYNDFHTAMLKSLRSIKHTHNSPESERGVQSIVSAIHMAYQGKSKLEIKSFVEEHFGHMFNLTVEDWRIHEKLSIRCNITAPQALICFMESTDFESSIRNAVYTKGDTDTIAAIAGSISEAFYGVESIPIEIIEQTKLRMSEEMINLVNKFYKRISNHKPNYKDFQI